MLSLGTLNTWNPWNDLAMLHRDLDTFFGRHFASLGKPTSETVFRPDAEVVKNGDTWTVSMFIPGVDPKQVEIELVGQVLRVRGERSREAHVEPYVSEISYGRFEREFALPAEIDADRVQAAYRSGVLELALPVKESAKPRRIAIATTSDARQLTAA